MKKVLSYIPIKDEKTNELCEGLISAESIAVPTGNGYRRLSTETGMIESKYIYIGSQILYDGGSGGTTIPKRDLIGIYDYDLLEELFDGIIVPDGYHKEWRLTFQGTTGGDNYIRLFLNNISTNQVRTWSGNSYRVLGRTKLFRREEIILETTIGFTAPGINLKYEVTGQERTWQWWNATLHGYLVAD